jgi:hypothetical protein
MGNDCCTPYKEVPMMVVDQAACAPGAMDFCEPSGGHMVVSGQGETAPRRKELDEGHLDGNLLDVVLGERSGKQSGHGHGARRRRALMKRIRSPCTHKLVLALTYMGAVLHDASLVCALLRFSSSSPLARLPQRSSNGETIAKTSWSGQ